MKVRLHAFEPRSRANGPGVRAVVWFQGCTLGCPGCFNPATHALEGGYEDDTASLAARILSLGGAIEGVSFSGGEPLEQSEALLDLFERLAGSSLGKLLFTGFTWREIERFPLGPAVIEQVDAVIAGRYVRSKHLGRALLGSTNQELRLLTSRYTTVDFHRVPLAEVIVRAGAVTCTGVKPLRPLAR